MNLQSNIFGYEILGIKILKIPPLNESGLYLISNNTKNMIKENDLIELNTLISLHFSYNGIIKKGSYLFKFAGVLQEATFDEFKNLSDDFLWNNTWDLNPKDLDQKYIEIFNERRNKNITGRVSLVRINVLDDIKVLCDEKYDETAIKTEEGKPLACGEGKYYEVENTNEIVQKIPGTNYYFDNNKNVFIKCHQKCKTCSREFNNTNMNCDECFDNFYIKNDDCIEIPKCVYNYYYDDNSDLHCIQIDDTCPDFKPFEMNSTKECIEDCNIDDFNKICNPTLNLIQ